jgi:hypothetical protein
MIRFRLKTALGPVEVFLDVAKSEELAVVQYAGSDEAIAWIQREVANSYGARGNGIGDCVHAIDLNLAMHQPRLQLYAPELITGANLVDREG